MMLKVLARYLTGYIAGFAVFIIAVPYALYSIATFFEKPLVSDNHLLLLVALVLGSIGIFFIMWSNAALLLKGKGGSTDLFNIATIGRESGLIQ